MRIVGDFDADHAAKQLRRYWFLVSANVVMSVV